LKVIDQSTPEKLSEAVTPDVANQLTTMMEAVVTSGTGTRAQIPGVKVAGKTGTAQHGDAAPHAWFVSFAPADDPQVAVAVVVEDGGKLGNEAFGGTVAAPIAKAVMEAVINK
jgi:penicillin-binding protein A